MYILRGGFIVCLTVSLLMGNTLFPVFAIKTNIVINVLQTYGIDYQGGIIDLKCCHIALRKGFLPAKQGKYHFLKLHQPKLTLSFSYYFLVSSDLEQFFLCLLVDWNSYSKSCPLFLVHFSIWLLFSYGSYLYIPVVNLWSDTCIAYNFFQKLIFCLLSVQEVAFGI